MSKKIKSEQQSQNAHRIPKDKMVKTKRFVLTKYKLNASIGGYTAGEVINIECRIVGGAPKDRYWRRRLRDAQIDNCMVKIPKEPKAKPVDVPVVENNDNNENK